MNMSKEKKTDTKKIAFAMLKPLIEFAQTNRGTAKDMAERLTAKTGKKIHRQLVEGWLHPEADSRNIPNLGMGLLIYVEGQDLMKQADGVDLRKLVLKGRA